VASGFSRTVARVRYIPPQEGRMRATVLYTVLATTLTFAPHLAFAQAAAPQARPAATPNPIAAGARVQFSVVKDFVVRAAEKVPENLYSFRATPEVRSFAELFGHVADAMYGMCSTADGSKPPREGGIEKVVTKKADLVKALTDAAAYCDSVMSRMDDKRGLETVQFYFGPTPRNSVLYFAVAHAYEHYGNIVTYMRLNKMVPPSSESNTPAP
jgi:uncharacterized damage-inducible protein DinB